MIVVRLHMNGRDCMRALTYNLPFPTVLGMQSSSVARHDDGPSGREPSARAANSRGLRSFFFPGIKICVSWLTAQERQLRYR
jgi:hypothetical protein